MSIAFGAPGAHGVPVQNPVAMVHKAACGGSSGKQRTRAETALEMLSPRGHAMNKIVQASLLIIISLTKIYILLFILVL